MPGTEQRPQWSPHARWWWSHLGLKAAEQSAGNFGSLRGKDGTQPGDVPKDPQCSPPLLLWGSQRVLKLVAPQPAKGSGHPHRATGVPRRPGCNYEQDQSGILGQKQFSNKKIPFWLKITGLETGIEFNEILFQGKQSEAMSLIVLKLPHYKIF